jgi:spermidine synthase
MIIYRGKDFYLKKEGDDLVSYTHKHQEYSRLDTKTGKSNNWYSTVLCNRIIEKLKGKKNVSVCMLGGAGGAMSYELLTYLPNVKVTTVDIDPESIKVLNEVILKKFGRRSEGIAEDAKTFIAKVKPGSFDVIVIDIFIENIVAPFVMTKAFTKACLRALKPGGSLLTNIISDASDKKYGDLLFSLGLEVFTIKQREEGLVNFLYESS